MHGQYVNAELATEFNYRVVYFANLLTNLFKLIQAYYWGEPAMRLMRFLFKPATLLVLALPMYAQSASSATLNINYDTTSSGVTTLSSTANSVTVPGTYNYGNSVLHTTGNVGSTGFGFYDDYIFTVAAGQLDSVTSTIDLAGLLGISNLEVRLFGVADALSPGTTGLPATTLYSAWSTPFTCGSGCSGIVAVLAPTTPALHAGTYDLQIRGTTDTLGGSYAGVLNATPVPLPAALPLLLSGFGLLGGLWRRRVV